MSTQGGELVHHREQLLSRGVAGVVATLGFALGAFGLTIAVAAGIAGGLGAATLGLPLVGVGALMAGLGMIFSMTQVIVAGRWVHVHFGMVRRVIPVEGIRELRVVEGPRGRHGRVETGFDGITRVAVGRAAGRRAVEIGYYDRGRSHVMVIGSEDPERLCYAIEQARHAAGSTRPSISATAR